MKELIQDIETLKKQNKTINRVNLAALRNVATKTYISHYINTDEAWQLFHKEQVEQKGNFVKNEDVDKLKGYLATLIKEKKAITLDNIAILDNSTTQNVHMLFGNKTCKDMIKKAKNENKILSANESFQEFYFKYYPFTSFKNKTAREIYEQHASSYFEAIQNFVVFCKHYNIPFKRVR